ncbi:hypothetical protein, partial [Staphylococcus aureus]
DLRELRDYAQLTRMAPCGLA